MNRCAKVMDARSVQLESYAHRRYLSDTIKLAKEADVDSDRDQRLKDSECKFCYYFRRSRIGGAAMTNQPCGICGKDMLFGSTNTDAICIDCAHKHSLCKHCGADRELRANRKTFAWIEAKTNKPDSELKENQPSPLSSVVLLPKRQG